MVELRKRPAPKEAPVPAPKRSASKPRTSKVKQVVDKAKAVVTGESSTTPAVPDTETAGNTAKIPDPAESSTKAKPDKAEETPTAAAAATTTTAPTTTSDSSAAAGTATTPLSSSSVGQTLPESALQTPTLTHSGSTSTLSALLSSSTSGIVIFTYPKASTPGCTTQACLFRDNYNSIRAKGYNVYGLSADSEKANSTFKSKQNLQYDMLCDPEAKLTGVLGMKKPGNQKGTLRGAVVVDKEGKVLVWLQAGPAKTVDAVKEFLG